jgi:hypothetical protein
MMEERQKERLYNLLPTIYRIRDAGQGEPLRALMDALESEFRIVEQDIDALYDNWFIETCDDWAVPYIASQIGAFNPHDTRKLFPGQRRQVADTIAYRRRKGMVAILEHVLRDVTDWYVCLLEYWQLLSLTPHLRNTTNNGRIVDVRLATELSRLGGPFDTTAHAIDIRSIAPETTNDEPQSRALKGKYSPGNMGVFVWRLQSYLMSLVPAGVITRTGERELPPGCFTFDPLGRDMPLFAQPQAVTTLTQRPGALNLPGPITHVAFADDLKEYREQHRHVNTEEDDFTVEDLSRNSLYYGPERSLCILLNGEPIPPQAVINADLSQWNPHIGSYQEREHVVAIDVTLGRLRLLHNQPPDADDTVEVNYCYGFSSDFGGGPYTRPSSPDAIPRQRINVLKGGKVSTLQQALKEWEAYYSTWMQQHLSDDDAQANRPRYSIHIVDNGLYEGDLTINLPKYADLVIEATSGVRPAIQGKLTVISEQASAHLQLSGLLLDGKLEINGSLNLEILHCTLLPGGLEAQHHPLNTAPTQITIDHSLVGPIHLHSVKSELFVKDSIIDHSPSVAIETIHTESGRGPLIDLERVTIFGKVRVQELQNAQDVIFTSPVEVENQQCGLISFSYVPAHSHTPRREHCQPQRTIQTKDNVQLPERQSQPAGTENELAYPLFTSIHYGNPAYAQLDIRCSPLIRRGASNGSEMGAFNSLEQAQRQDNISQMLDEYLPFGLEAGVFYVT